MNEYIYNKLPSDNDIRQEAAERCLDSMFRLAQPSTTLAAVIEASKAENKSDGEPDLVQNRYYLPIEIQKEIADHYMEAYGIASLWPDYFETMRKDIFEGGYRSVQKTDENWAGIEKLGPLHLSKKDKKALEERLDECRRFYKFNGNESSFSWAMFNYSPNSNAEAVQEYWRSHGDPEFVINEDVYSDDYEMADDSDGEAENE